MTNRLGTAKINRKRTAGLDSKNRLVGRCLNKHLVAGHQLDMMLTEQLSQVVIR